MNSDAPTSQMQKFESELVRRFFHPKSYFFLCFSNQIETLTQSEAEPGVRTAVNTINRLVTNLVSAGDAYAEWTQLVRRPGLEELHRLLSGKIIWLSQQSLGGEELKQAIESIAKALFDMLHVLVRQNDSRRQMWDFLEGDLTLADAPLTDWSTGDSPENPDAEDVTGRHVGAPFSEIMTDDLPQADFTNNFFDEPGPDEIRPTENFDPLNFEAQSGLQTEPVIDASPSPEIESSAAEISADIHKHENLLFSQFRAEATSAIKAIIQQCAALSDPGHMEKRLNLLQTKLNELNELSMIQGFDIVENLSFKLLNCIPNLEKSGIRIKRAYFDLAEDTLHFMLNWLNTAVPEVEIRDKFNEIRVLSEAIEAALPAEFIPENASEAGTEPFIPEANPGHPAFNVNPENKNEVSRSENEASEATLELEDLIFNSVDENDAAFVAGDAGISEAPAVENQANEPEKMIEAVPDDEAVEEPVFSAVDLEASTETIRIADAENQIQLPGEDDVELKQLINDIFTAKMGGAPGNEPPAGAESERLSGATLSLSGMDLQRKQITEVSETDLFKSEAALYLKIIQDALTNLKEQPNNLTFLEDIELSAYSIKRLAQKMGFELLSRLPEQIENYMADLARKRKRVSPEIITNIADAITFLNNLEKNDLTMKEKLKNILFKLNEHDKQLIY